MRGPALFQVACLADIEDLRAMQDKVNSRLLWQLRS